MKNNNQPVTKKELTETLGEFSEEVLLPAVKNIVGEENAELKHELKEYMDEKNADLRGDIIVLLRREDRRLLRLIEVLYQKEILDQKDIKVIEELQIFPGPTK